MTIEVTLFVVALAAFATMLASVFNVWQIRDIHILINSRMTQLLDLTEKSSLAEGRLKEKQEEASK